jgi:hypothetical protein
VPRAERPRSPLASTALTATCARSTRSSRLFSLLVRRLFSLPAALADLRCLVVPRRLRHLVHGRSSKPDRSRLRRRQVDRQACLVHLGRPVDRYVADHGTLIDRPADSLPCFAAPPDQIDWIAARLAQDIRECPASLNIDLQIFVTRNTLPVAILNEKAGGPAGSSGPSSRNSSDEISPNTVSPSSPDVDEKKTSPTPSALLFATSLCEGRPDLGLLLREAVAGAGSSALAINVCGPHAMSSDVKRALRDNETAFSLGDVAAGKVGHVSLHCEAFVSRPSPALHPPLLVPSLADRPSLLLFYRAGEREGSLALLLFEIRLQTTIVACFFFAHHSLGSPRSLILGPLYRILVLHPRRQTCPGA